MDEKFTVVRTVGVLNFGTPIDFCNVWCEHPLLHYLLPSLDVQGEKKTHEKARRKEEEKSEKRKYCKLLLTDVTWLEGGATLRFAFLRIP
jgi:hypothetical protein